jgi:hypothetical protein
VKHRYTGDEVDWIAVYDATTDLCFYIPSGEWDGLAKMNIRLVPPSNGQLKRIRFASRYRELTGDPRDRRVSGPALELPLPLEV